MRKFKVGDRVRFKTWKEMEKEFGVDFDSDLSIGFVKSMKHLCNTQATIKNIYGNAVDLTDFTATGDIHWSYSLDMLKHYYKPRKKVDDSLDILDYPLQNIKKHIPLGSKEAVNHPSHYNQGKIEVIDYIEDKGFNFNLGNAIKYISRCEHKGKKVEDIKKAIWYLQREIDRDNKNDKN